MHSNFQLVYSHKLDFDIFHDISATTVTIKFNNTTVHQKEYSPGNKTNEVIHFEHAVPDGGKNVICIDYNGGKESEHRYLKLNSIEVQGYKLDILHNYYDPKINQDWWQTLSHTEQTKYQEVIHVNNNAHFGWFGQIIYEYFSGADKSKQYLCEEAEQERIAWLKTPFIFEDKDKIKYQWTKNEN